VPDAPLSIDAPADYRTFREIAYTEEADVGYLSFDFYNGAMSTTQCYRLRDAFLYARSRPTRIIVLLGGRDFWSNGIDLSGIEASVDPAEESWRNINAIDDLIVEILNTTCHFVLAGLRGNAGAGGAMLALAADRVYAKSGVVLNPHYRSMGLYGSEYWTYTLPRRVGRKRALELTESCQPIGTQAAREIGFIDDIFGNDASSFEAGLKERAAHLAQDREFRGMLRRKHESRLDDECFKPLAVYRDEELDRMRVNFFGSNRAYHEARRRFVYKGKAPPQESWLSPPGRLSIRSYKRLTRGANGIRTVEPSAPPVGLDVRSVTQGTHHLPPYWQFADSTALVWTYEDRKYRPLPCIEVDDPLAITEQVDV
jgi:putative two-component system hydrogenase maturation factor HypX/HoxX